MRVVSAVVELTTDELRLTDGALERDESRPYLPIDVLPLDALLVVHVLNKAVKVEEPICHVLRYHLSVEVDEDLRVRTHHPLVLLARVQLTAVDATR